MNPKITYKELIASYKIDYPVVPVCPYFGECGGCRWQNVPYGIQIARKRNVLQKILKRDIRVLPSPDEYGYRSRMDFVAAFGGVGFRPAGSYTKVIDIERCHLVSDKANFVLSRVKSRMRQLKIPDFNYTEHKGLLRYVIVRQTSIADLMVILVTATPQPGQDSLIHQLAEALLKELPVKSIWWETQDGIADLSRGTPQQFWGTQYISEQIDSLRFNVGPNSFFQNNVGVAKQCFQAIREAAAGPDILDLYCGTGVISLLLHAPERRIVGVESESDGIQIAELNKKQNGISDVNFVNSDVRKFLVGNKQAYDTVILDPPRSGAGRKVMKHLANLGPRRIIYMSCNPDAFIEDMAYLSGYKLEDVTGFDMFPQTTLVELMAIFDKRQ